MAMPIKKPSSGRSTLQHGAPAPGATGTPPQEQKGMNGSNAAPPNKGAGMSTAKPSAGRSVSMPKHAAKSGGKEAPPASSGGRVGPSRAGESAQPVTAPVAPDVSGGTPSTGAAPDAGASAAPAGMAGGSDPQAMIQAMLMQAMQGHGGGAQMPGQQPVAMPQNIPPELAAMIASSHAGNPDLQTDTQGAALADLIRRMMIGSEQQQKPSAILSQLKA